MSLLKAFLLFFAQPLFWVGVIAAIITSMRRIKKERTIFRVAIYKEWIELRNYLTIGVLGGIILSIIMVLVGVTVTSEWIIVYQVVSLVSIILFGYRFIHPIFTISLTGILLLVGSLSISNIDLARLNLPVNSAIWQLDFVNFSLIQNSLIVIFVAIIFSIIQLKPTKLMLSPNFRKTSRGKWIASYLIRPFYFLPLFLFVPGEQFTAIFEWWPVFSLGNTSYTIVALPLLIGFRFKIQGQVPKKAIKSLKQDLMILAGMNLLLIIVSYFVEYLAEASIIVVGLGGLLVLFRHYMRERNWKFLFGPVGDGLKIIGLREDTPATKMNLEVGETIILCNQQEVRNEEEFYSALLLNSAYCHLKIRGIDGEYRLTETAIYADSPHELGVVTIPEKLS
ncbi:topological determinant of cell division [Carnobacterium gallinarum]|uniref:topological determinant of cell division n=1 Tax=Carnobacterium gallinarum TaxID=2749 RepID=UPI000A972455|nr:topological determinant of cell division [Carnobacterium gallinarum]